MNSRSASRRSSRRREVLPVRQQGGRQLNRRHPQAQPHLLHPALVPITNRLQSERPTSTKGKSRTRAERNVLASQRPLPCQMEKLEPPSRWSVQARPCNSPEQGTQDMTVTKLWVCAAALALAALPAWSQDFVLDNNYDCAKATNGKAYCKQVGKGLNYFPVSEEFLNRFLSARSGAAAPASHNETTVQQQQIVTNTTNNTVIIQALTNDASEIRGLIDLYTAMISEQKEVASKTDADADAAAQAIEILSERVNGLQRQFSEKTTKLSNYQTSIRPNDPESRITARKASELFPKVPWYIPGSPETGEFWIEPLVNDFGTLTFNMKFVDPKSANDKIRSSISLSSTDLERIQKALVKLVAWSKTAHERHVRSFLQRVDCFPEKDCPAEGQKIDGVASTEVVFQVNEEGATSGRIQRNKGRFVDGYNMSMESTVWLQAYLKHVLNQGKSEFEAGSRTQSELKALFK